MRQDCVYGLDLPLSPAKCRLGLPDCENCQSSLPVGAPDIQSRFVDPLVILDRRRQTTDVLRNLLAGHSAFLLGGGPSANGLPLKRLAERGVWTLAVNNAAGHPKVRPQAMICADPPKKFSHSVWLDPAVMKFVPTPKLNGRRGTLRRRIPTGFESLGLSARDCPNVWAYQRYSWLTPDDSFFLADGALWGNHATGCKATGQEKTVCTMLLSIRILYYLGARKIYLLGVDFTMSPAYGYSFDQERTAGAAASNNRQFGVVNGWLCEMQDKGVFKRFGLELYNVNENSGLRAFSHVPFDAAIEEAEGVIETVPDLRDWYTSEK